VGVDFDCLLQELGSFGSGGFKEVGFYKNFFAANGAAPQAANFRI
jgi:hypothetical protein